MNVGALNASRVSNTALRGFTHLYESAVHERVVTCHDNSRRRNGGTVALFPRSRLFSEEKRSRSAGKMRRLRASRSRQIARLRDREQTGSPPIPPLRPSAPSTIID